MTKPNPNDRKPYRNPAIKNQGHRATCGHGRDDAPIHVINPNTLRIKVREFFAKRGIKEDDKDFAFGQRRTKRKEQDAED